MGMIGEGEVHLTTVYNVIFTFGTYTKPFWLISFGGPINEPFRLFNLIKS